MTREPELQEKVGFWGKVRDFFTGKWHYLLVLLFGVIISVGIWGFIDRTLVGDDYTFHVVRLQPASHAWSNGQIMPQVDPDALGGFGYAYNLFYGPILTYLAAGLQVLVSNWNIVINLVLIICLVGSGLTMCYAMMRISKNKVLAAMVAILYMAAPYHLTDVYSRVALGEVAAFVVAPFLLLGLFQLTNGNKHAVRNLAISAAFLILTHSLSTLLFALMAVAYVILNIDKIFNVKTIWRAILAVMVALGLSAFFVLPLAETKLEGADYGIFNEEYAETYFGANSKGMNDHRLWVGSMLLTDSYTSSSNVAIGMVALIGLLGYWFVRKRIFPVEERRFVTTLYLIGVLALLFTTPLIDWRFMPDILLKMQFPWRFLQIATLVLSVVSGYTIVLVLQNFAVDQQKVCVVIAGMLALCPVMDLFLPNEVKHLEVEDQRWSEIRNGYVGWEAEYAPSQLLCSTTNEKELAEGYICSLSKVDKLLAERGTNAKVISGKAKLSKVRKDGLRMSFMVSSNSQEEVKVELPLIYYPGYEAQMNEEKLEIEASDKLGLVTVIIPSEMSGEVEVKYGLTTASELGMFITAGTVGISLAWIVIEAIYDAYRRKKDMEIARIMDSVREVMEEGAKDIDDGAEAVLAETEGRKKKSVTEKDAGEDDTKPKRKTTVRKKAVKQEKVVGMEDERKEDGITDKTEETAKKTTKKSSTAKAKSTKAAVSKKSTKATDSETVVMSDGSKGKITKVKAAPRPRKDPE